MNRIGLFPGSFDPFTKGHEAVVRKAFKAFDEIVIGIGINNTKLYMFDLEKRMNHIRSLFEDEAKIKVEAFDNLTVDYCKKIGANFIIRGLRDANDFDFEKSIAQMNYDMSGIDTIFFLTDQKYAAISSTIIREIHKNGGEIHHFVTKSSLLV